MKTLVLDIDNVIENLILIQPRQVQDTQRSKTCKETPVLLLFSSESSLSFFLDPTLEIDSASETILLHVNLHQGYVHDLRLHQGDLLTM